MSAPSTPVHSVHTLAEILSQPEIWIACQRQLASDAAFKSASARLAAAKEILFVGCGSSLYLAESAAAAWMSITGRRTRALPASEILLFPNLCQLDVADLHVVVISRSGKTSEAIRAADFLTNKRHLPTIGITCAVDSELSKFCDLTIALPTADEKSMVMTRSFTSMLQLLAGLAGSQLGNSQSASNVEKVSAAVGSRIQTMNERIESFVAKHTSLTISISLRGRSFLWCVKRRSSDRDVVLVCAAVSHIGVSSRSEIDRRAGNVPHICVEQLGYAGRKRSSC